ncbi:hypothetical protein A3736_15260 [Erythrobacter sp. HI0063]|uniref:restriction endonuclease subunit S n=1 Tax=Erythrobacter sp. HI0063 TaxID=1822240 RepID=UPI0007C340B7|nr:restriction endonuclease subunit S [Erythrobacter sp. HI0063]KZY58188.1 hypothetical protein A3736_15260 [Erythrobacter sp. HI0063]
MRTGQLGDHVEILSGFAFKSDRFNDEGQGLPLVRIRDVKPARSQTYFDGDYDARFVLSDGDLLVGMDGEFNCARWAGGPALLNQRVCRVRAASQQLDEQYLFWFLPKALKDIEDRSNFVTVKHLSAKQINEIEIPLPSLDEQKRIAAILDQADELRCKRQRAIDRLNQLGQAIFHEMFGDPVAPSNRLASRLIDIAELINGDRSSNYPSGNDIKDEGILFLNTTNIRAGELDFTKAQFINEAKFRSLSRGKLQRGDLVITLRGTLGQCALFDCQYETGFINAQMMIIRAKATVLPRFLREYISFPSVQAKLKGANSGSAVPQLTATQMKEMQILLPALDDQRRFVDAIDSARSVQNEIVAHANRLDGLFASLQHRAFQGEL